MKWIILMAAALAYFCYTNPEVKAVVSETFSVGKELGGEMLHIVHSGVNELHHELREQHAPKSKRAFDADDFEGAEVFE